MRALIDLARLRLYKEERLKSFKRSLLLLLAPLLAGTLIFSAASCETKIKREKVCSPESLKCDDAKRKALWCGYDGEWALLDDCASSGGACLNGRCVNPEEEIETAAELETTGTCEPGSLRCKNETVKQFCGPDGQWTHDVDCAQSGKVCQAGRCEVCLTGATRCNPENPTFSQKCGYAGNFLKWVDIIDCSILGVSITCVNGVCQNSPDGDEIENRLEEEKESDFYYEMEGVPCKESADCGSEYKYCFKMEGASSGVCLPYCDQNGAADPCPLGYTCSAATLECERIGFCVSSDQCVAGKQFCDLDENSGWGICRNYCYSVGESCPQGTKCCLNDDESPECANNKGKCVSSIGECVECYADADCSTSLYCEKPDGQTLGCCKPKCYKDEDCAAGLTCRRDGRCSSVVRDCDCDGKCPLIYCDPVLCFCTRDECPACPPGECCNAASSPNCVPCNCENPPVCGPLMRQCCLGYYCSAVIYGVLVYCIKTN